MRVAGCGRFSGPPGLTRTCKFTGPGCPRCRAGAGGRAHVRSSGRVADGISRLRRRCVAGRYAVGPFPDLIAKTADLVADLVALRPYEQTRSSCAGSGRGSGNWTLARHFHHSPVVTIIMASTIALGHRFLLSNDFRFRVTKRSKVLAVRSKAEPSDEERRRIGERSGDR